MARKRRPRNKFRSFPQPQPSAGVAASGAPNSGPVDIKPMIAAIKVPPKFQDIYNKVVLKGNAIMFSPDSHQLMLDELDKPGPMAQKLSQGVVALVYILFEKSNKTLPPQILEAVAYTLLLSAFDFLQQSGDPEATRAVLGEATHKVSVGIHNALGVSEDKFAEAMAAQGKPQAGAPPPTGMLGAQNG